jgi:hypothetical protein
MCFHINDVMIQSTNHMFAAAIFVAAIFVIPRITL